MAKKQSYRRRTLLNEVFEHPDLRQTAIDVGIIAGGLKVKSELEKPQNFQRARAAVDPYLRPRHYGRQFFRHGIGPEANKPNPARTGGINLAKPVGSPGRRVVGETKVHPFLHPFEYRRQLRQYRARTSMRRTMLGALRGMAKSKILTPKMRKSIREGEQITQDVLHATLKGARIGKRVVRTF